MSVRADHFFLRVAHWLGFDTYADIWSPHLEDGEALYGALLFADQLPEVLASTSLAAKSLRVEIGDRSLPIPSRQFFRAFAEMHERALDEFDFNQILVV